MNIKQYLNFGIRLAKKAGDIALENYGRKIKITYKGMAKNNLVTEVDEKIENMIVKEIEKHFPTHCILTEETGNCGNKHSDYRWVIDPIDGTTNYAHCYSFFAISIGLEYKGQMIAGVINAPYLQEIYHAEKGLGAFMNGKPISVSTTANLETALLATGFTYHNRGLNLPNFEYFLYNSQGLRRCGAATLDLCHVAAGRLDGYWEMGLKPWDIAAGSLIVKEAGGRVTALDGSPCKLGGKSLLAANPYIHKKMVKFFKDQPRLKELFKETSASCEV